MTEAKRGPIRGRVLLVAFEGWADAGDSATDALRHIIERAELVPDTHISGDDYYDYTVARPLVRIGDRGARRLVWPASAWHIPTLPEDGGRATAGSIAAVGGELYALLGIEPHFHWHRYVDEFFDLVEEHSIETIVFIGSMFSDVPHTRDIPVLLTSQDPELRRALGCQRSQYEGPAGIMSAIGVMAERYGIPAVSVWANVPHYAQPSPAPKATVALIEQIGDLLGTTFPLGGLLEQSRQWEESLDEVIESDDETRAYLTMLEERRDTVDSPEASGEALARKFEQYLQGEEGESQD